MVVIAAADCTVDVNLELQRAGLRYQVTEYVVLEQEILVPRRHATSTILIENGLRFRSRRVGDVHERTEISRFKFDRHRSILLVLLEHAMNRTFKSSKLRRELGEPCLCEVSAQRPFLDRKIHGTVGTGGKIVVVKREHVGVDEDHKPE